MNRVKRSTLNAKRLTLNARTWRIAYSVVLLAYLALSVNNCGRLPPEKFWTGDNNDSANVKQEIEKYNTGEWQGFLSRFDFVGTLDTVKFLKTKVFAVTQANPLEFKIKQTYWPSRLEIALTSQKTDTNFTFVYDTTVTVELVTKIKGIARIGCDSVQAYQKDTIIGSDTLMIFDPSWKSKHFLHDTIVRGETVLVYDTLVPWYDSIVLTKAFDGQIWRSLYLEPEQKNASSRVWKLKKMNAGSTVRIPDSEDDAPYNYYSIVKEKSTFAAETIYDRPDTIHYGIHRLYQFPDSFWSYRANQDSLEISTLYPILNPQDTIFYFAYCDHYYTLKGLGNDSRAKLTPGIFPQGINYYSIMLCPRQGLIYKKSPFKLRVWQMPVKVQ